MKSSSSVRLLLLVFLLMRMFLRVGAALRFPTVDHPDEIFETQEPAHHLAYGYSVVVWEWRQWMRSRQIGRMALNLIRIVRHS